MGWALAALGFMFAVTFILGLFVYRSKQRADRASHSRQLAFKAADQYASNPDLGVRLALRSVFVTWKAGDATLPEAQSALELVTQSALPVGFKPISVFLSADWKHIATLNRDDTIQVKAAILQKQHLSLDTQGATPKDDYAKQGSTGSPLLSGVNQTPGLTQQESAAVSCQLPDSGTSFWSPGSDVNTVVALWEANSVNPTVTLLSAHVAAIPPPVFSRDGKYLAFATFDPRTGETGTDPILWEVDSGLDCERYLLAGHTSGVSALAFSSSESSLLAVGSLDGTVKLWDIRKPQPQQLRTLKGSQTGALAVSFSPDGRRLATAGSDGKVSLQDVGTGEELHVLEGPKTAWISAIALSRKLLAIVAQDNSIWIWDTETGMLLKSMTISPGNGPPIGAPSVAFSRDGKRLAATSGMSAKVWDVEDWSKQLHPGETVLYSGIVSKDLIAIAAIDMNENGSQFVTVNANGTLVIHTIALADEISRAEKRGVKELSPQGCKDIGEDEDCNDVYRDKKFNPAVTNENSRSADNQARR